MERERLKDLCTNALFDICQITPILRKEECGTVGDFLGGYLADNGVIFLPCKVGDTVFVLGNDIEEWTILHPSITYSEEGIMKHCPTSIITSLMGKSVFLTREAAEAALKERE